MCLSTQSACFSNPALRFKEIVLFIHTVLILKYFGNQNAKVKSLLLIKIL